MELSPVPQDGLRFFKVVQATGLNSESKTQVSIVLIVELRNYRCSKLLAYKYKGRKMNAQYNKRFYESMVFFWWGAPPLLTGD